MASTGRTHETNPAVARAANTVKAGGRRADLYLLSGDDSLLLELGPLLGDRFRTRPIDSAEQIDLGSPTPWILLIDAVARADARAQAARIEQQHSQAPLLVVCADGKAADWASALSRGTVSAVIERSAMQSGALDAALQTAQSRLSAADKADTTSTMQNLAWPGKPSPSRSLWILLAAAAVFAAGGTWYYLNAGNRAANSAPVPAAPQPDAKDVAAATTALSAPATAPSNPTPAAVPVAAAPTPRPVLELLSDARVAFREGKNLLPRGDNAARGDSALELYAAVLAQDAQNDEARDGLRRLYSVARARMQADLAAGRLDDATRMLSSFRDAGIASDSTAKLEADIAAARPRWLVAQARAALTNGDTSTAGQLIAQIAAGGGDRTVLPELRRALETHNTEAQLQDLAARARAAISAGTLLEPAGDNARTRVQLMQQLGRTQPLTLAVQRELQTALLGRAQSALRNSQFDLAQQLLGAAADYGNNAEVASARNQLQTDSDASRERAAAAANAARDTPATPVVMESTPEFVHAKPVSPLSASYPQHALDVGQQGYVIVEFTLNVKGQASDAKAVESVPPGVFDSAAIQAVKRGRYDTTPLGESGKPRRARLRITFKK